MSKLDNKNVLVKDLIRQIHTELIESQQERQDSGHPPLFEVKKLTIEAHFVVSNERDIDTGIGLTLVKAGLNRNYKKEEVHKITLELGVTNTDDGGPNGADGNYSTETISEENESNHYPQEDNGHIPFTMPAAEDNGLMPLAMPAALKKSLLHNIENEEKEEKGEKKNIYKKA